MNFYFFELTQIYLGLIDVSFMNLSQENQRAVAARTF